MSPCSHQPTRSHHGRKPTTAQHHARAHDAAWHTMLHGTRCCMAHDAAWHMMLHGTIHQLGFCFGIPLQAMIYVSACACVYKKKVRDYPLRSRVQPTYLPSVKATNAGPSHGSILSIERGPFHISQSHRSSADQMFGPNSG